MKSFFQALWAWLTGSNTPPSPPAVVSNPKPIELPKVIEPIPTLPAGRPSDLPESNHYATSKIEILKKEYEYLVTVALVISRVKGELAWFVSRANANISRYKYVAGVIGCPWFFVALIHYREASMDFNTCLHNGDKLPGPTRHVPAGRGPFKDWEAAAIDALIYEGFGGQKDWSLGAMFWRLEAFNGFGYRVGGQKVFDLSDQGRDGTYDGTYRGSMQDTTPRNASPYIYNGTQFYEKGVSIEDHSFYPKAVDDQPGCMALFIALGGVSLLTS